MMKILRMLGAVLLGWVAGCADVSTRGSGDATGTRVYSNGARIYPVAETGTRSKSDWTPSWEQPPSQPQTPSSQPQTAETLPAPAASLSEAEQICGKSSTDVEDGNFSECREQLFLARKQIELEAQRYQLELQRYQLEKARYDAYLAEVEKEKARRSGEWLMKFGLALAGGTSGNFATDVGNAGYVASGLPPLQPPTPPSPPVIQSFKLRLGDGYTEARCSYNTLNNTLSCR